MGQFQHHVVICEISADLMLEKDEACASIIDMPPTIRPYTACASIIDMPPTIRSYTACASINTPPLLGHILHASHY